MLLRRQSKGCTITAFLVIWGLAFCVNLSGQFQLRPSPRILRLPSYSFAATHGIEDDDDSVAADSPCPPSSDSSDTGQLTTALLRISYDGSRFTGWSAANDGKKTRRPGSEQPKHHQAPVFTSRRRKRNWRGSVVRSVQGLLKQHLAKLYGNVDPSRIVVEGCSRTDKGVHARCLVAQFYCLTPEAPQLVQINQDHPKEEEEFLDDRNLTASSASGASSSTSLSSIPGKRLPHPRNATDATWFVPIPFSLSRLSLNLNRMCTYDMRIMAIAPTPFRPWLNDDGDDKRLLLPFHPTLSTLHKTYQYKLSFGSRHDPIQRQAVWHIHTNKSLTADNDSLSLLLQRMQAGADQLRGTHDFGAFEGAPRGATDKHKRRHPDYRTICTIESATVHVTDQWVDTITVVVAITGDRFLYKMVRFLVGALVALGLGELEGGKKESFGVSDLIEALETGVRPVNAFECAPAKGLVLHQVHFNTPIAWQEASS